MVDGGWCRWERQTPPLCVGNLMDHTAQRLVAADGEYSDKDNETKHFGLIWVRFGPGWPGGWPAEAAGKAGCFFKPARFWLPEVNK